ncbi:MAG: hypothetical protein KC506_02450 [Nanoarchaeota archaeon]|nr:hypothetical protein [Nanoarchaeota archaeon]
MRDDSKGFGKEVYQQFGPDTESKRIRQILDFMIYSVGFLGTVLALPQAYIVWISGGSSTLSLYSWIALAAFTPFWIVYGLLNKQYTLSLTYAVWLIGDLLVIAGLVWG